MPNTEAPSTVKSAMRTLDILEFLVAQARPLAAHELASALAIPVSSLSYLLSTLVERGYLARDGRRYAPGPALARLHPSGSGPSLAERVAPLVRSLCVQLHETATFFVRHEFEVEAIASEVGMQALRYTLEVGRREPMHSLSAGKALLASLAPEELDRYFATVVREKFTPRTVTDEAALRAELDAIRRTGIAYAREERTPGIIGLGCAASVDGRVVGAFGVAIPSVRFDAEVERKSIQLLTRAADMLASPCAEGSRG